MFCFCCVYYFLRVSDARNENYQEIIADVYFGEFEGIKNVRQLETVERHLPPKCTNFGFFTTKMYEFWVFYHQSVRILVFFKEMYEYWGVT